MSMEFLMELYRNDSKFFYLGVVVVLVLPAWYLIKYHRDFRFKMNNAKMKELSEMKCLLEKPKNNQLFIEQSFEYCFGYFPNNYKIIDYFLRSNEPTRYVRNYKGARVHLIFDNGFKFKKSLEFVKKWADIHRIFYTIFATLAFVILIIPFKLENFSLKIFAVVLVFSLYFIAIAWLFLVLSLNYFSAITIVEELEKNHPDRLNRNEYTADNKKEVA